MKQPDDPFEHHLRSNKSYVARVKRSLEKRLSYDELKERRRAANEKKAQRGPRRRSSMAEESETDSAVTSAVVEAIVVSSRRRVCEVELDGVIEDAVLPATLAGEQQSRVTAGDRLLVERRGDRLVATDVLPRHSVISRPDPHVPSHERAIAANVDQLVHVVSVVAPPLHPRLIDRYLIAAQRGGVRYVLCVNKIDLLPDGERSLAQLEPYHPLAEAIVLCSAATGEGLAHLRELLAGRQSVLAGHSGVGKSSLVNALAPSLRLDTGEVSDASGRGRHTTTATTLLRFDPGTTVIDTPGIRELGLWAVDANELRWYFPEFARFAADCRYRDCTHDHEPSCAVRAASENGRIASARYQTYLRLVGELTGKSG